MKFNIDDYSGKYVMHCVTEEEAERFCEYLDSVGRKWSSLQRYTKFTNFDSYLSKTVYYFNEGTFGTLDLVDRKKYYVLRFSDFDWYDDVELSMSFDEMFGENQTTI